MYIRKLFDIINVYLIFIENSAAIEIEYDDDLQPTTMEEGH